MTGLEIILEPSHLEALKATKEFDRGYIFVKKESGLLVAQGVHEVSRGPQLIVPSELDIIGRVLREGYACVPYINSSEDNPQHGSAFALFSAENVLNLEKFVAYGIINVEPRFYHLVGDGVTFVKPVPFRLPVAHRM
ncbi:Uncharacterised protein [uncultured archaeon]|nr:Uncharacterised protein [uncultured archaeon]